MKFRWVPWYKTTFEIDENCIDFMERLKTAICFDDWEGKRNDYIGYVGSNGFRFFFRKFLSKYSLIQEKEFLAEYSTILWGKVVEKGEKCKVEIIISIYWLGYIFFLPLFVIPIIGFIVNGDLFNLFFSVLIYAITLVAFNLRAHVLYNFFLKILHDKPNFY